MSARIEQGSLQGDAQFLQQHANIRITIEGHCDERGSTEYNLALGTNRADAVKNALIQAGVAGDRIKTISYGKEKPFCTAVERELLAAKSSRPFCVRKVKSR